MDATSAIDEAGGAVYRLLISAVDGARPVLEPEVAQALHAQLWALRGENAKLKRARNRETAERLTELATALSGKERDLATARADRDRAKAQLVAVQTELEELRGTHAALLKRHAAQRGDLAAVGRILAEAGRKR